MYIFYFAVKVDREAHSICIDELIEVSKLNDKASDELQLCVLCVGGNFR